jgi:hypothetical protein
MIASHRTFMKAEIIVLLACVIYAALSLAFVFMSAASLLGPAWPPTFLWLSVLSAVVSIGVFIWWRLRARVVAALASAGILAGVAAVYLWAAEASSAAV